MRGRQTEIGGEREERQQDTENDEEEERRALSVDRGVGNLWRVKEKMEMATV